jgi:hypothetical protein
VHHRVSLVKVEERRTQLLGVSDTHFPDTNLQVK